MEKYYMGNIKNGTEINSWTEQNSDNANLDPGRDYYSSEQVRLNGTEQERVGGTGNQELDITKSGRTDVGGILRQLIQEYESQLATKKQEIEVLQQQIERLKSLEDELSKRIEDNQ